MAGGNFMPEVATTSILTEEVIIKNNTVVFERHGSYIGNQFIANGYYFRLKIRKHYGGTQTVKHYPYDEFKQNVLSKLGE